MDTSITTIQLPQAQCTTWVSNDWIGNDMLHSNDYADLRVFTSRFLLTIIKCDENQAVRVLYYWLDSICIGGGPTRVLQRAWRRHRERRRLAVCTAMLEEDGLLGRVIHTLCHEELKSMIP